MGRVRLKDIANRVGVSPSTVSRALNDHPRISDETKAAVRRVLAELSALATRPSPLGTVGLFLASPNEDPFFSYVVQGAVEAAHEFGCQLLVEKLDGQGRCLPYVMVRRRIDGCIIGGLNISDEMVMRCANSGVPSVFLGRYLSKEQSSALCAVISDNVAGGRLAARHLLDCGYEQFAVLLPRVRTNNFEDRLQGFTEVASARSEPYLVTCEMDGSDVAQVMLRISPLLKSNHRIGIFAMSDFAGTAVMKAISALGVAVPDRVGVIGYDGLSVAQHASIPMSTIDVPKRALGYLAIKLLDGLVSRVVEPPVQLILQPRLVVRQSTGCPRGP